MIVLRPLLMLYGTLHVEGSNRGDKERRAGDVVAAGYFRNLARVTILHAPWGRIIDPTNLRKIKDLVAQATVDTAGFNASYTKCRVENTLVWEHLKGNMRDAVAVWVDRKLREENAEVMNALSNLVGETAAA